MIPDKKMKTPLCESLYNTCIKNCWFQIMRYYAMNFDFFEMEPHVHKEFEIMYVASGSCRINSWSKDDIKEEWNIREGEYVLIDSNTCHQLEVVRGTACRILNLEIAIMSQEKGFCLKQFLDQSKSLQDFFEFPVPIFKGYDGAGNLHTIITELHKQLQSSMDDGEHKIMQNLILAQFILEVGRQRVKKYRADSGSKYVRKALNYIANHYEEDIKVKDIAVDTGISAAYLQRLFKEQADMSLVDKINEHRIEKAKILLETSRLPVTDIAVSVGFNNRQHFTYTFLKYTGCSPAIYRKHKGDYRVWNMFEE